MKYLIDNGVMCPVVGCRSLRISTGLCTKHTALAYKAIKKLHKQVSKSKQTRGY